MLVFAGTVIASALAVLLIESLLAWFGFGNTTLIEKRLDAFVERVGLLEEELRKTRAQIDVTRADIYPRLSKVDDATVSAERALEEARLILARLAERKLGRDIDR